MSARRRRFAAIAAVIVALAAIASPGVAVSAPAPKSKDGAQQPAGQLATPRSGKGRPVLVLHAWWGLNDTFRDVTRRLAEQGFVAFAPDLYGGRVTDQIAEAEKMVDALDGAAARARIRESVDFLLAHTGAREIAVVGFSLGAFFALDLAAADPERVRRVVLFYGTRPGDYGALEADVLGHFAAADPFESRDAVDELEAALRKSGRTVTFHHYPGTGHWFFEPDRKDAFNAAAARLAWERTLAFLRR